MRGLGVSIYMGQYFVQVMSVEWGGGNGELLFFVGGNRVGVVKCF